MSTLQTALDAVNALGAELDTANANVVSLTSERDSLQVSLNNALAQAAIADSTIASLQSQLDAANAQHDTDVATIASLQAAIASAQATIDQLNTQVAALQAQLNDLLWDYFISPTGTGNGTQASPASVTTLDTAIASIGPGARIAILAGTYTNNSISLSHGGTAAQPVIIGALNGAVYFVGSRNSAAGSTPYVLPDTPDGWRSVTAGTSWGGTGSECFRLLEGANFLTFQGINVKKHSRAWSLYGNIEGLVVKDAVDCFNCQDYIWNSYTAPAGAKNLTVKNCNFIGFSKSCIRFSGASDGLLIEDVVGNSGFQVSDNFAMGVFISDVAKNVSIYRTTMRNSLDVQSFDNTKYWNGDGFVGENGCDNIYLEDCLAEGCSDGGYDFKSTNVVFVRCTGRNNKKNWRIWGVATLNTCVSETPHKVDMPLHAGTEGGSGSPAHIEMIGGINSDDMTLLTLINSPISVAQVKPDNVTVFYGTITIQ